MFQQPKYIQNRFSVTYARCQNIRRLANSFEDLLSEHFSGHYNQPQIIPIPDELDPEVPRIVFGSKHGFSQIVISQIGITLSVTYSPDWQENICKGQQYLEERLPAIYCLLDSISKESEIEIFFCGLVTRVRLQTEIEEGDFLDHVKKRYLQNNEERRIYDITIKTTNVIEDKFFCNTTIQNYRNWKSPDDSKGVPRLPVSTVNELGLEIVLDFNDRYAYNNDTTYCSKRGNANTILTRGMNEIRKKVEKISHT
jgi:hypothetical protein